MENKIAQSYIGERANTDIFKFQELIRNSSSKYNGKHAQTGWFSLLLMSIIPPNHYELLDKENEEYNNLISEIKPFLNKIRKDSSCYNLYDDKNYDKLRDEIKKNLPLFPTNVRNYVKDLWTYPKNEKEFEPFKKTNIILQNVFQLDEKNFQFKQIGKGCVYASHTSKQTITDLLWKNKNEWFKHLLEIENDNEFGFKGLEIPPFNSHITILNSNIGEKYKDLCGELIEKYNWKNFDIKLGELVHTFDERFAPYETCVVIEVKSKIVDDFIKEFNELTNEKINISQHIIIAVRLRK